MIVNFTRHETMHRNFGTTLLDQAFEQMMAATWTTAWSLFHRALPADTTRPTAWMLPWSLLLVAYYSVAANLARIGANCIPHHLLLLDNRTSSMTKDECGIDCR
jgi:hypothetical protein